MSRLLNSAGLLSALALSCAACNLDVTPEVAGMNETRALAGRGATVMAESAAPALERSRDDEQGRPPLEDANAAGAAGNLGNAGTAAAVGNAMMPETAPPSAGEAKPAEASAKKPPMAGQMAAGAPAPAPKPVAPSGPVAGSAAPAAGSVSKPTSGCKPGDYVGAFAGTVQVLSLPVVTITGTVTAELVANKAGDTLVIASSRVEGMADEQTRVTAKLSGKVNCATLELEEGALEDGVLTTPGLLGESSQMTFSGKAAATYSTAPSALKGMWQAAPDSALSGSGSWSVALSSGGL